MADIFVSYKREDRSTVERLAGALQQLGFEVWWDFELLSGENFRGAIRAVIEQCRAAIVVWSKAAIDSSFVLDEAAYALRLGRLCPVTIEQVDLPFGFGQTHADDLCDWSGELSHPGFQNLVKAIEQRVGRKAKFGRDLRPPERQAASAELEAFKAAELAGTSSALRTFVASHPSGAFAAFVRDQIDRMERERAARPAKRPAAARAAEPAIEAPKRPGSLWRQYWRPVVGALAISVVLIGVYLQWNAVHQADLERVREQAQRAAAEAHAKQLEAQAAAERSARERADERLAAEQRARELEERAGADRAARERADAERLAAEKRAQAADARAQGAQKSAATPVLESAGARPPATFAFESLPAELREVALVARANAKRADDAASRARTAAEAAEAAARRARAKEPGTTGFGFDGGSYLGEGSGSNREGNGVVEYRAPSAYAGDRYTGQFRANVKSGLGVYTFGANANNTFSGLRREGEYGQNRSNGLGVIWYRTGERFSGQWRDSLIYGPGVRVYSDGSRFEGEWQGDRRNGKGVLFATDGRVLSAGTWQGGKLVEPFRP
ncbi:MAG TPA: TIR domain-containing protein [Burkholderiaceae bacterium]|nr:TIR domain-containing protein [Burkholderiaceae bacterium]